MSIINSVDDFKVDGIWQEYRPIRNGKIPTTSKLLHDGIILRVGVRANYMDCVISEEFQDFQFFANWCNSQIGYGNIDSLGRRWVIDKDIKIKNSRAYAPESCSFIPARLNLMMSRHKKKKNGLPLGVSVKKNGTYTAFVIDYIGVGKSLGVFDSKSDAFDAYRKNKESVIRATAMEFADSINPETFKSLMNWRVCEYENFTF